jgi:hypothetical protein
MIHVHWELTVAIWLLCAFEIGIPLKHLSYITMGSFAPDYAPDLESNLK